MPPIRVGSQQYKLYEPDLNGRKSAPKEEKKIRGKAARSPSEVLSATTPVRLSKKALNIDVLVPEKIN